MQVTEKRDEARLASDSALSPSVEAYMIRTRKNRSVLFLSRRSLEACAATDGAQIRRFIRRLVRNRFRFIRWVGRVTRTGYRYYQKLEDKIDPHERMIKALNCEKPFAIRHAPGPAPHSRFRDMARGQTVKHAAWMLIDGALTLVVILLAPFLVPIPGPNVFLYYPALRMLSHYRAMKGARRAADGIEIRFEEWGPIAGLEEALRSRDDGSVMDRAGVDIEGLEQFLARMG